MKKDFDPYRSGFGKIEAALFFINLDGKGEKRIHFLMDQDLSGEGRRRKERR